MIKARYNKISKSKLWLLLASNYYWFNIIIWKCLSINWITFFFNLIRFISNSTGISLRYWKLFIIIVIFQLLNVCLLIVYLYFRWLFNHFMWCIIQIIKWLIRIIIYAGWCLCFPLYISLSEIRGFIFIYFNLIFILGQIFI